MANLTISVDDDVLKQARLKAIEQGTSVNALLREYLEAYAGVKTRQEEAVKDLLRISENATSGRGGRRWTRDELHER
jgi:plasmid stability protein